MHVPEMRDNVLVETNILILPGIGNSGPEHWQTYWERANPSFVRIEQHDWDHPICSEWVAALETAVQKMGPNTVLVAHSLACLLVAHWAATTALPIHGALLVSVPDPDGPNFPKEAIGFSPVPQERLGFPSIVVASTNDPYGSEEFTSHCATVWGSRYVVMGALGHINSQSALDEWPEGFALLQTLLR